MGRWFSRGQRPRITFIKMSDDGLLAGADGKLWRLSERGYVRIYAGDQVSDGFPSRIWVPQDSLPVLEAGMEIIVISEVGEENRCSFNRCGHCGNNECLEHTGEGGKGKFPPVFTVAGKWILATDPKDD